MAESLRIKALCINLGYAESARASSLIVRCLKPFTKAADAVNNFVRACRAAITPPAPKAPTLKACCLRQLKEKPKAKACSTCGGNFKSAPTKSRRSPTLDDYLRGLADTDVDGFREAAYPHHNAPSDVENGEVSRVGDWIFFGGLPNDADVVEVEGLDMALGEYGSAARFTVLRVAAAPSLFEPTSLCASDSEHGEPLVPVASSVEEE